ncbi:response regulator [Nonomuraea recticatena]|uniref:response regulator n=1 Tax=Nonomuraea recticatena TaxID=46178 RepID=UPI003608814A
MIRLLLVDDHPIVRDGLRAAFETEPDIHVAGEAANGREGIDRAAALKVDIVLMDLRMPEMDGVSAITALRHSHPHIKTLVLTTFDGDSDVLPAIEAGATATAPPPSARGIDAFAQLVDEQPGFAATPAYLQNAADGGWWGQVPAVRLTDRPFQRGSKVVHALGSRPALRL